MVAIAGANILVSFTVALLLHLVFKMNANPANALLAEASDTALILFYLKTAPQLFGGEGGLHIAVSGCALVLSPKTRHHDAQACHYHRLGLYCAYLRSVASAHL